MKIIGIKDLKLTINRKTKDDVSKHWNEKQLRNITYRLTKESDPTPFNAADQIVHVEELVKTHLLVYSVKHINEVDHPVITLYSK